MPATGVAAWLDRLAGPPRSADPTPVLLVVAHPDDDILALGSRLPRLPALSMLFATDGAPRDLADARRAGQPTRDAYAALRRAEALAALALGGVGPERIGWLGLVDQEAFLALQWLVAELVRALRRRRPALVVTHAYDGGHPDHDSLAFAVRMALRQLAKDGMAPSLVEFAGYHAAGPAGLLQPQRFLPGGMPEHAAGLDVAELALKRAMLTCHASQATVLAAFDPAREAWRLASAYDFTRPPHEGPLYYERHGWAVDGAGWRQAVAATMAALPEQAWL